MGPITQPKFVGQQRTSPGRASVCAHESPAHLTGESCVHGMAFGSPMMEYMISWSSLAMYIKKPHGDYTSSTTALAGTHLQ